MRCRVLDAIATSNRYRANALGARDAMPAAPMA